MAGDPDRSGFLSARTPPTLVLATALAVGIGTTVPGCQPAEVGTVGVPRPVGPDGKPLPPPPKGGPEPAPKAKAKAKATEKDMGGK